MLRQISGKIIDVIVRFAAIMNATATVWTFLLMFFITADVIGRFFFNHPLTGAPELVKVSLVALVFLHMPHTLWVGRHIRSEMLTSRMGRHFQLAMQVIMHLLGVCMFAGIVYSSWHHMVDAWQSGTYAGEGSLHVPLAPVRTIVILGSTMTAFLYFVRTVESIVALTNAGREKA